MGKAEDYAAEILFLTNRIKQWGWCWDAKSLLNITTESLDLITPLLP